MKSIKMVVELPIVINDYLLDIARNNRRVQNGPRTKEQLVNKILKDYFFKEENND